MFINYQKKKKKLGAYNLGPGSFHLDLATIFLKGKNIKRSL